jgi:PleD family two-component response regulator
LGQLLREFGFMAPFGGEEFVIVLPKIDTDGALILLKRIRKDLANKPLK